MAIDFSSCRVERVPHTFQFLEGPVWIPSRQELLFSDIPASRIMRLKNGKLDVYREPSDQANGNAIDPQERLVSCHHETRCVTRTGLDGTVAPIATHFEGKRLNSPNDVVCKSDGSVYFSDPPYGVKAELRELDFQGVFRVPAATPQSGGLGQPALPKIELIARDFVKPNGLAFSTEEKILYIADTEVGHIRAFDVLPDGSITNSRIFCKVERPDGFRVDVENNLYISCMKAVEVFNKQGTKLGEIVLPERPANLAFGDEDRRTLYICARTSLYRVRVPVAGR